MSKAVQDLKATLVKQLASGQKFTDNQFPPKPALILGPAYAKSYLRRASDLYSAVSVIPEDIHPNDIEEGLLKDSYFLSSVANIAEDSHLIKRLFLTEEANNIGLYAVWLCDNGTWRPILLDDHIPCSQRSGTYFPQFAQSINDDIWITLLEKAYAKINGSYSNIEDGSVQHALRDLTGAPVEEIHDEADPDKLWKALSGAVEKEYFLSCSTPVDLEAKKKNNDGPINRPACNILDTKQVKTARGIERLILIRDPWKSFEWKGEWSNDSDLWTEDLRKELNYNEEDAVNRLFWIKLEDYITYFPTTWICRYKAANKYYSVDLRHDVRNYNVIRLRVHKEQEITISLNQKDERWFKGTNHENEYDYSYSRLLIGRVYNEGLGYVGGNASEKVRNLEVTERLKPGTYIITSEVYWNQNFCSDFNISFYGEDELDIESVPEADLLQIQKSLVLSSIEKVESSRKVRSYAKYGDAQIEKTEGNIHGLLYFYYLNDTKKGSKLVERVSFSNLEHMEIMSPFAAKKEIEVEVVPDHEVLVLLKASKEDFAWSYSTSFNIQPGTSQDNFATFPQEPYDYIDNPQRKAPIEVNQDYNLHVLEGRDLDFDEQEKQQFGVYSQRSTVKQAENESPLQKSPNESWRRLDPDDSSNFGYNPQGIGASSVRKDIQDTQRPAKKYPPVEMQTGQTNSKKIAYTNYDKEEKDLTVVSSNPKIATVKDANFKVKIGETGDIRLRFSAPKEPGNHPVQIEVRNQHGIVEEVLHFVVRNVGA